MFDFRLLEVPFLPFFDSSRQGGRWRGGRRTTSSLPPFDSHENDDHDILFLRNGSDIRLLSMPEGRGGGGGGEGDEGQAGEQGETLLEKTRMKDRQLFFFSFFVAPDNKNVTRSLEREFESE